LSNYFKPVLALLISILLFAVFIILANTELLDFVQTHFYNPSVVKSYVRENTIDAEIVQGHIFELQNKFANTLREPAVRSSFLYNQSAGDIYERSRIFGILLESTGGLQSVQFVDAGGVRIHYSTSVRDIISQSLSSTSYRNYNEDTTALPYETVSVPANGSAKFVMDEQSGRIIYSYPFFDSIDVYRGTAIFTVSVRALGERLVAEGRLKVNDDVSVIGKPPGILFGSPDSSKTDILAKVAAIWNEGIQGRVTLDAGDSGAKFSLISMKTGRGIFFGRLISDYLFSISAPMKLILQLSMFLTLFLTLFFLINFRPSPVTLVQSRIKTLREHLFEQLYVNKSGQDRIKWILELEQRREEIRSELKRRMILSRRTEKTINGIIDKSWDELLSVIKSGAAPLGYVPPVSSEAAPRTETPEKIEEIEEIEEIAEEIEEVEEAEDFEETESQQDADDIENEEITDEIEIIDEAEVLDEVEEIKEVKKTAPRPHKGLLERASKIEEVEEIEEIEELEELEEVPPASVSSRKGLLARAIKEVEDNEEEQTQAPRGLLALASEIEFNSDYPVGSTEDEKDLDAELNIASPFLSMFSSLENKKRKKR